MLNEIILAVIQAVTEFLPVSSSGHLALVSKLFGIGSGNLFFFTVLHIASLLAVLIFTRKEIMQLLSFDKKYYELWIYLIVATIPAGLAGYYFHDFFAAAFNSYLMIGVAFLVTGLVLLSTKNTKVFSKLNVKNAFAIGVAQIAAILPGISRSGVTISSGMFLGLNREKAARFSFLLFIPLSLGAVILESGKAYFSWGLAVSFLITLFLSLIFLNLLMGVIKKGKFWLFSFYCFAVGLISLGLYYFI